MLYLLIWRHLHPHLHRHGRSLLVLLIHLFSNSPKIPYSLACDNVKPAVMASLKSVDLQVEGESSLRVVIVTWNVGNAQPKLAEMSTLLGTKMELENVDLVVCGSQEAVYNPVPDQDLMEITEEPTLTNKTMDDEEHQEKLKAYKKKQKQREKNVGIGTKVSNLFENKSILHFQNMYTNHLKECGFTSVACTSLGEMRLFVFAKSAIEKDITVVESAESCTGLGGVMANKGGILTSFLYKNYSFAFISSHLAAHMQHYGKRNENIWEIVREARTADKSVDALVQHDFVFWMGDLNYRVDLNTPRGEPMPPKKGEAHKKHWAEAKSLVDEKKYAQLLEGDQLKREQEAGMIFHDFIEAPIAYKPTFKVQRVKGTTYKEQRSPSYCDRILWRTQPYLQANKAPVVPEKVEGLTTVSTSDHKPIRGVYKINLNPMPSYNGVTEKSVVAYLSIKKVQALKLIASDIDGTSDPYLQFRMYPFKSLVVPKKGLSRLNSSYKSSDLNPTFGDKDLPTLVTRCTSVEELRQVVLYISYFDYDTLDADDELGGVRLYLKDYFQDVKTGKSSTVKIANVPLVLGGKVLKSTMSCEIDVYWKNVAPSKPASGGVRGGCCIVQ